MPTLGEQMAIGQTSTNPIGGCSAIPYHLVPAPQYNQGTDNGCDDAGTPDQGHRGGSRGREKSPLNFQYSRQNEALWVIGEGEIHLAIKPAMAPTMITQTICMFLSYTIW